MKKTKPKKLPHKLPADLRKAFASVPKAREKWNDITPLARNEFICWILDAKKSETINKLKDIKKKTGKPISRIIEKKFL